MGYMQSNIKKPLIASIPHAGEKVAEEAYWLKDLPEITLMYDVDRFVDQMYQKALEQCEIPTVMTHWHRYVVDCNRWPGDIDEDSVEGAKNPSGSHPTGLHWRLTTAGFPLMKTAIKFDLHQLILKKYYYEFFQKIDNLYDHLQKQGAEKIYHLNLHSMPSLGTSAHRDPGQLRADIVIGNEDGKTASTEWTMQVCEAYKNQGFSVSLNRPYKGGTDVEKYGHPQNGHEALMIELNRKLYMDESTKQLLPEKAEPVKKRLQKVIADIHTNIADL